MTDLVPTAELIAPVPIAVPSPPRFGAALASVIFLLYLIAQTMTAFVVALAIGVFMIVANGGQPPASSAMLAASMPAATVLAFFTGGIIVAVSALVWARHLRAEAGPRGLGWRRGTPSQELFAALGGVAVAILWTFAMTYVFRGPSPKQYGPLVKMLSSGGWGRYAVAFTGVVLAPPVEELLFRGILLAGYVRRFGLVAGSVITTLLFVLMHLGETIHYLPALGVVTAVGIILLLIRLRTDSIFVAMAFHMTYNAVLMIPALVHIPFGR